MNEMKQLFSAIFDLLKDREVITHDEWALIRNSMSGGMTPGNTADAIRSIIKSGDGNGLTIKESVE